MTTRLLTVLAIGLLVAVPRAQSLADAAKAAQDASTKQESKTPAKRYTDKDLKEGRPSFAEPTASGAPSSEVKQAAATAVSEYDRAAEYRRVAKKDEAYWKDLMRSLHSTLDNDRTLLAEATTRERALNARLRVSVDNTTYIRDRIERANVQVEWQNAVSEKGRLQATITNDARAISNAEYDAHAAGVPPGWLVVP